MSTSSRWWRRYEHILDQKPVSAKDALVDQLAKSLVEILVSFPPRPEDVEWQDERSRARFEPALDAFRPLDAALVAVLAHVVTKDLANEAEELDHYFKSGAFARATGTPLRALAIHFLWPVVIEVLLSWRERASLSLLRADLTTIVERGHRRFRERHALLV